MVARFFRGVGVPVCKYLAKRVQIYDYEFSASEFLYKELFGPLCVDTPKYP